MTDDPLAWETVDERTAYDCPGFDVVNQTVRLPDGTETDFDYVTEPPSVVILPFTTDGEVVVIEEWRQAVGRVNRGLPAGGMERADGDVLAAARRELEEETGYVAGDVAHRFSAEPANGFADALFHYVVARDCEPAGERDLDFNESIRVDTTSFAELRAAALSGDLRDGRSALAVCHHALREAE